MKKRRSGKAAVRRAAEDVIMVCLAGIILLSGWKVFSILKSYDENRDVYSNISDQARDEDPGIDFDALRKINPDVIGWIRYEGTPIDYPIVQGADNERYLTTMFDGTYGVFGTLFADAAAADPFRQFNTVVYGHHMRDGSMFGSLKKLKDQSYCEDHPSMELVTPDGSYRLDIWAFLNQPADSAVYTSNIDDAEDRREYIEMIKSAAEYTCGADADVNDRLVILSTCAYEYQNARYIVVCKIA